MALAAIILLLLEKVPYTQLIFCSFQMGSQLGHSKHLPSSFFIPSFQKGITVSSAVWILPLTLPVHFPTVVWCSRLHWLFLQCHRHSGASKAGVVPEQHGMAGFAQCGCDLTDTLGYRCPAAATATQQTPNHSPAAAP